jgi:hypothetical protein
MICHTNTSCQSHFEYTQLGGFQAIEKERERESKHYVSVLLSYLRSWRSRVEELYIITVVVAWAEERSCDGNGEQEQERVSRGAVAHIPGKQEEEKQHNAKKVLL